MSQSSLGRMLANPVRRLVFLSYCDEPVSASTVARRLGQPLNLVSYHTGVLARHGCLELVRSERRRGRVARLYRAAVEPTLDEREWLGLAPRLRRSLAVETVDEATEEARRAARHGGFDSRHAHISRMPLELDAEAMLEIERLLRGALREVAEVAAACRGRPAGERRPYEVVLLAFEGGPLGPRRRS